MMNARFVMTIAILLVGVANAAAQLVTAPLNVVFAQADPGIGNATTYDGWTIVPGVPCGKKTCTVYEGAFLNVNGPLEIHLDPSVSTASPDMPFAFGILSGPSSSPLPSECAPQAAGFASGNVDFRFTVGTPSRRGDVNVDFRNLPNGSIDGDFEADDTYYVKGVVNFWRSPTVYLSLYYNHSHDGVPGFSGFTGSDLVLTKSSTGWTLSHNGQSEVLMECRVSFNGTIKVYTVGTYSMPFSLTAALK